MDRIEVSQERPTAVAACRSLHRGASGHGRRGIIGGRKVYRSLGIVIAATLVAEM